MTTQATKHVQRKSARSYSLPHKNGTAPHEHKVGEGYGDKTHTPIHTQSGGGNTRQTDEIEKHIARFKKEEKGKAEEKRKRKRGKRTRKKTRKRKRKAEEQRERNTTTAEHASPI